MRYIIIWLVALLTPTTFVWGEKPPLAPSLTCLPDTVTVRFEKGQGMVFMLTSGKAPMFKCTLDNPSDQMLSFMVVSQMTAVEGDGVGPAVSMANGQVEARGSESQTLAFPEVFRPGAYRFTFAATNTETKAELTTSMAITGLLEGKQSAAIPKIVSVVPQESDIAWGGQVSLAVTLAAPFQIEKTTLRMALLDQVGAECVVLDEKTELKQGTETYTLTLPKDKADVCGSTIAVEIRDETGTINDRKTVALRLPAREVTITQQGGMLMAWWNGTSLFTKIGLAGAVLLSGIFVGLRLMRRSNEV